MPRASFTPAEKEIIKQEVYMRRNIIENKKTDGVSVTAKRKAWAEVLDAYNTAPDTAEKSLAQIQKAWDNIKQARKRQLTKERTSVFKTGGGSASPTAAPEPEVDAFLKGLVDIEVPDVLDSNSNNFDEVFEQQIANIGGEDEAILSSDDSFLEDKEEEEMPVSTNNNKEPQQPPKKKQKRSCPVTAYRAVREKALAVELSARVAKVKSITKQEEELYELKREEAQVRLKIAKIECNVALLKKRALKKILDNQIKLSTEQCMLVNF